MRLPVPRVTIVPDVALLNDTSNTYHWGCTATSAMLRAGIERRGYRVSPISVVAAARLRNLPARVEAFDDPAALSGFAARNPLVYAQIEAADLLVINGEGTLHDLRRASIGLLYCAYLTRKRLGKAVHIVNHSCFPRAAGRSDDEAAVGLYRMVYEVADHVVVRDPLSKRLLERMGVKARRGFDCLPLWIHRRFGITPDRREVALFAGSAAFLDEGLPTLAALFRRLRAEGLAVEVVIGGGFLPADSDERFVARLHKIQPDGWTLVEAPSVDAWLRAIGSARLLVSGRFHHTIAAACLGTPFVMLESNTPKMLSLARMLGEPPPLPWTAGIGELLPRAMAGLQRGAKPEPERRMLLARLCRLARRNFDAIPVVGRG